MSERARGGEADRVVCSLHNEEIPLVHLGKDGRTDGWNRRQERHGGGGCGMMMERTDMADRTRPGGTRWIRDCCGMY